MNKVLITGANGFVGRAMRDALRSRNIPFTGAVRNEPLDNTVAVGDIDAKTDWSNALRGCDAVIHLAARVHVMNETVADPLSAFRCVNVEGTLNLARQAWQAGVKRFVYVSSIKVNGEATTGTAFRHDDIPAPADPYGLSKWEAEQALIELMLKQDMELVIIRPPLVYGDGVKANFEKLIKLVQSGVPLPLGGIKNKRSMVFVGNLVDLICICLANPAAAGKTFLVSDGVDLSTTDLIIGLQRALGKSSPWVLPCPVSMIKTLARLMGKAAAADRIFGSLQVDIGYTRDVLNWTPPFGFEEGLRQATRCFMCKEQ